ncbi:MAG: hypothetical protein K5694_07065, partial [Bacilli bacterium]|nr:hypothetical protein [Bacilli bacterium]
MANLKSKLLFVIAASLLFSCGGTPSSSSSSNIEISSAITSEETSSFSSEEITSWDDEQISLMKAYLYGEVLPYPGFKCELTYDSVNNSIAISSLRSDVSTDELNGYLEKFVAKDGWISIGTTSLPSFSKTIETSDGNRHIHVLISLESVVDERGVLSVKAFDPFVYEWPSDYVDEILGRLGSESVVPPFEADAYTAGAFFLDGETASLYCINENEGSENEYALILAEASYDVSDSKNAEGYYEALSPNEDLSISFAYQNENRYLELVFKANTPVYAAWPSEQIAA